MSLINQIINGIKIDPVVIIILVLLNIGVSSKSVRVFLGNLTSGLRENYKTSTFLIVFFVSLVGSYVLTKKTIEMFGLPFLTNKLLATVFSVTGIHELGHWIFSRIYGRKSYIVWLLPIEAITTGGNKKLLNIQEFFVVVGGCAFNSIASVILYVLSLEENIFLLEFISWSMALFSIFNLFPFFFSRSDGYKLRKILFPTQEDLEWGGVRLGCMAEFMCVSIYVFLWSVNFFVIVELCLQYVD